jgi:hypothetical protein
MDPNGPRQAEEDGGGDEEYGDTCLGGYALVRRDGKLVEYSLSEDQGANCHRRSLGYGTYII